VRWLIDTRVFLWSVSGDPRLTQAVRDRLLDAEAVFVSAASIWEIAIKVHLGKLHADVSQLVDAIPSSGFQELPVWARHTAAVATLPPHHGDPFDRLLLAQAVTEPLRLMTADRVISMYGPWVELI
jgi:PIN domain nuclease of toxin-antitoxin system